MLLVPMPRAHRTTSVAVADVFSVDTYSGNNSSLTITNGIDLAGQGGLVWLKDRSYAGAGHQLYNTANGVQKLVSSSSTAGLTGAIASLQTFTSSGFSINNDYSANASGYTYVGWTFRKAAKFFDVVTYTGTGTTMTVAHSLGSVPGCIFVKRTNAAGGWLSYHRAAVNPAAPADGPEKCQIILQSTAAVEQSPYWNNTAPTSAVFTVKGGEATNISSAIYVAYIFAHDATGIIDCGSYTGNGSGTGPTVTLGWQPQYVMIKRMDDTGAWYIYDSARSTSNPRINKLLANSDAAEDTADEDVDFNATSFQLKSTAAGINANTGTYMYMAIKAE